MSNCIPSSPSACQSSSIGHSADIAPAQQSSVTGRTVDSRTVKWMATGSEAGGASISVIGGLAAMVVAATYAIIVTACGSKTDVTLTDANKVGGTIMKPVGNVVGGAVGVGLAGAVNLTSYITGALMTFARSLFADATQDASDERRVVLYSAKNG